MVCPHSRSQKHLVKGDDTPSAGAADQIAAGVEGGTELVLGARGGQVVCAGFPGYVCP